MMISILLFAAEPAALQAPIETTPEARTELNRAIGAVLQGDGARAEAALQSLPISDLSLRDREFRDCSLSRLAGEQFSITEWPDPFVQQLLSIYRRYWHRALQTAEERSLAERDLLADLADLFDRPAFTGLNEAEASIAAKLDQLGLHAQMGQTGVLRELMIWRNETRKVEQVNLPEGAHATTVFYLDNFLSRGWSSYLTCNRTGTGGWTTNEGLFAIVPSYESLTDENFRVNFLAHESQHFADTERFGELPQWRLEYRAKLVELIYADATRERVLWRFQSNRSENVEDAHSYANNLVLVRLRNQLTLSETEEIFDVPPNCLRTAATVLLRNDSEQLVSAP